MMISVRTKKSVIINLTFITEYLFSRFMDGSNYTKYIVSLICKIHSVFTVELIVGTSKYIINRNLYCCTL